MAAKSISVSLPESLAWKLEQLEQRSGISKSSLVQKALLLLIAEFAAFKFEFGEIVEDISQEEIDSEYRLAGKVLNATPI